MTPKLISIVVAISFCSPGLSEEPNNAIDWFQEEPNKNQETIITKIGNKENIRFVSFYPLIHRTLRQCRLTREKVVVRSSQVRKQVTSLVSLTSSYL